MPEFDAMEHQSSMPRFRVSSDCRENAYRNCSARKYATPNDALSLMISSSFLSLLENITLSPGGSSFLNSTPSSNRIHIGIFGSRNAGKSTLMNAIIGQDLSVVSSVKGTTTDTVSKAMELLPLGPVVLMDAPGYDDEGELGELRVGKCMKAFDKADAAILVLDPSSPPAEADKLFLSRIKEKGIPCVIVLSKKDETEECSFQSSLPEDLTILHVSARTGEGINELKETLGRLAFEEKEPPIIRDLINPGDIVLLESYEKETKESRKKGTKRVNRKGYERARGNWN